MSSPMLPQMPDPNDFDKLIQEYVLNKPQIKIPENIQNIQTVKTFPRIPPKDLKKDYQRVHDHGRELVREGKVAALLVAGGQGTRLGYDGPKGEYPVTPVKSKPLFQVFAEQLLAHSKKLDCKKIAWYVMTSDANFADTKNFFDINEYFGYPKEDIFFFQQGMMPAFSFDGKILYSDKEKTKPVMSPDGHGGCFQALLKSGALADMKKRGVEHLSYFQVDNPLVNCLDYTFIGLHDLLESEMSSKTVAKAHALEKVGNFVMIDGKVSIIEYSDISEDMAKQTTPDGSLRFNCANIAIHALRVNFIERLTSSNNANGGMQLPWHRAEKKVTYMSETGELVKPDKPNAVKLEQFIFDAIPLAKNALVYETDRAEEFSPVKNADGADSPTSSRNHQIARAARWLTEAGITIPMKDGMPETTLEISPLFALTASEVRKTLENNPAIAALLKSNVQQIPVGSVVYFGDPATEGIEGLRLQPVSVPVNRAEKLAEAAKENANASEITQAA